MSKRINAAGKAASRRTAQKTARAVAPVPAADLVTVERSQPVTTTERVAAAAGIQHKNVLAAVREHLGELQEYGQVAFQTRLNPQGSPTEYALLGFEQSTLLFTFLRNSPAVRAVKVRLVREFFRTSAELARLKAQRLAPEWRSARVAAAAEFTNVIEMLRECREAQGKTTTRHHYINEATLMRHAFSGDSKTKWDRDNLSAADLKALSKVERLNMRLLARDVLYADRKAQCRALWLRATGFILEGGAA